MQEHISRSKRMEDKPVEVYCPICGFSEPINDPIPALEDLTREERVAHLRMIQNSENPLFLCKGCENCEDTARILEIR